MPAMSFSEAAKAANVNPSTIHRAVKKGKLSAKILHNGNRVIDPAELSRVYPSERPRNGVQQSMPDNAMMQDLLDARQLHATALQRQIDLLQSEVVDLRRRLDDSEQERRLTTRLLSPPGGGKNKKDKETKKGKKSKKKK